MPPTARHILIVDDDPAHVALIKRALLDAGSSYAVAVAENLSDCRDEMARRRPDMVLLDLNLPDGSTLTFLEQIAATNTFPVLIMTSSGSETLAVEALKAGAIDYLVKSRQAFHDMPRTIERCLREWNIQQEHQQAISALRESERRFRTLLQDVRSVAVQGYHADGTIHYWNRASEELYGYTAAEALGKNLCELIIPADLKPEFLVNIHAMSHSGTPAQAQEYQLLRKDGSTVVVYTSHAILEHPGRAPEFYCIDIDITELKQSQAQINKLSQVVEQSPTMVLITDLGGVIEYVNPFFSKVTGYTASDLIGTDFRSFQLNSMTADEYQQIWRQLEAGEDWRGEVHNRRKDGSTYWERVLISPLRDKADKICNYISIREDISAHKEYEQQLHYQATHDALTGLVNRSLLKDRIDQAINQAQRYQKGAAVLLLDLDGFKIVNDTCGHVIGDELLVEAARRLTAAVRETDTVARLGGDEFVVLLVEVNKSESVALIAEKIRVALNKPFHLGGRQHCISASIGISMCPGDGKDSDTLIRLADMAMYQAKKRKDCFSFFTANTKLEIPPSNKEPGL